MIACFGYISQHNTNSQTYTSLVTSLDLNELRKAQDFDLAEQTCKVIKGELANTLHKLRTNQVDSSAMSTPARFGHYHQVLVRARKKCANLHRLIELTGKPSTIHDSLSSLLSESRLVFAELERKADAAKKRTEKKIIQTMMMMCGHVNVVLKMISMI